MDSGLRSTPPGSLLEAPDLARLCTYAEEALGWEFVEKDADLYYQRMFNLAGDVVKLAAEVERLSSPRPPVRQREYEVPTSDLGWS